jgi:hypothetical protein
MSAVEMFLGPDHMAIRTEPAELEVSRDDRGIALEDRASRRLLSTLSGVRRCTHGV